MSTNHKSFPLSFKKLMGLASFFRRSFNSSKCKTEARLATARIKLLRNKREVQVRQLRRDLAVLLQSKHDDTAMIRVEHVIREQNVMSANEIIELFCELIVVRLPIIAKQRDCPADLKEGISSLIYAAPRCSEIPELQRISDMFERKYGKDFVSAAKDLRPESGVNRMLVDKLSVRKPSGEVKMKVMKEIAKEYQIDWDTAESEKELLKPPEEFLEGPRAFVSASSMAVKPAILHNDVQAKNPNFRETSSMEFMDMDSAAKAAADSAAKAAAAAQAAAYFAAQNSSQQNNSSSSRSQSLNTNYPSKPEKLLNSQSFNKSSFTKYDEDMDSTDLDDRRILRRNSYAAREVHSDIKFDDSDDEEININNSGHNNVPPPNKPPPAVPHANEPESRRSSTNSSLAARVHPKLPDYESLAARFESLKSNRK